jgi:cation diffusion facilitator CzcD-associated flavoprotein CzcO
VYSFALNPSWRTALAKGPEIWKYYHGVAERYGILPHIQYGKEVTLAEFGGTGWRVTTRDGTTFDADIVISATGRLHHAMIPDIPGAENFAGPKFHSARWDKSVDIVGKRVGLIGTGSSATQIAAAVIDQVAELTVFQRTPQWVFPLRDVNIPWWRRLAFRLFPPYARKYYLKMQRMLERIGRNATGDRDARAVRDQLCMDALNTVKDPELRAKLTPKYEVGCKRLVMSETFYEAVQKQNFHLVTDAIDHIEKDGLVTRDGKRHTFDILVFATGFDAHAYMRPMDIKGESGVALADVWKDLPVTYRSVAIPHMPNFFLLNGPYSPGGTASIVGIVEVQAAYLMQLIARIAAQNVTLAPRTEACAKWLESARERARGTVWNNGGCKSWYLDKSGTPAFDPITLSALEAAMATPDFADFVERPAET